MLPSRCSSLRTLTSRSAHPPPPLPPLQVRERLAAWTDLVPLMEAEAARASGPTLSMLVLGTRDSELDDCMSLAPCVPRPAGTVRWGLDGVDGCLVGGGAEAAPPQLPASCFMLPCFPASSSCFMLPCFRLSRARVACCLHSSLLGTRCCCSAACLGKKKKPAACTAPASLLPSSVLPSSVLPCFVPQLTAYRASLLPQPSTCRWGT